MVCANIDNSHCCFVKFLDLSWSVKTKVNKRAGLNLFYLLTFLIFLLSGCAPKSEKPLEPLRADTEKREIKDVLSEKWLQPSMSVKELTGWEVVEYIPNTTGVSDEDAEIDDKFVISDEQNLYCLIRCKDESSRETLHSYCWNKYDLLTMEHQEKKQIFSKQDFENVFDSQLAEEVSSKIVNGRARVTSADACSGKNYIFLTVWNDTWEIQHFFMIEVSGEGTIQSAYDFKESAWINGEDREGRLSIPQAYRGNDGTVYLLSQETLRQFGENGENVIDIDLSGIGAETIQYAGKSGEGIPVFCALLKRTKKVFFCAKDGELLELWQGDLPATICRLDQYGYMLMLWDDRLMTWNVLDGEVNCLYQFTGLSAFGCADMARNANGEVIIWYGIRWETNDFVYRLNDAEHPNMKELVLLQSFQDEYTAKCAADYTRTHPGVKIIVEQMKETGDMEWNKLATSIASGEGPDLILANRQQISILKDTGMLMCLTDLLSDEVKNNLFSGALRFGTFGNDIFALPYEASLGIWMIRHDLIPESTWNLTNVMDAYEEFRKRSSMVKRVEGLRFNASSTQLLYDMCLQNLEHSEFIDFKSGECNFNKDTFVRLLRFCYENGENTESDRFLSTDELVEDMIDGKTFLYYVGGGLIEYSNARSALGDQYVTIGYPSDKKASGMIHCYRGIAINETTKNKDVAVDFLLSALSKESQLNYTTYWIRRDLLQERVNNDAGDGKGPFVKIRNHAITPLKGRKDGSSYLDEYMALMDAGEPLTVEYSIRDIVIEEAAAYFAGEKTEIEVAGIIQKRVQNYLNEQK